MRQTQIILLGKETTLGKEFVQYYNKKEEILLTTPTSTGIDINNITSIYNI